MNKEKLIEAVRGYIELYDLSRPKYIDIVYRDANWKGIGQDLQQQSKNDIYYKKS